MPLGFFTARADDFVGWARRRSLWPISFSSSCCASGGSCASMGDALNAKESGMCGTFPESADLLVIMGAITRKQAPILRAAYDRMAEPRWVVALGTCAASGGCFANYSTLGGASEVVPVDVLVPGCPPSPRQLADAVEKVRGRIGRPGKRAGHVE